MCNDSNYSFYCYCFAVVPNTWLRGGDYHTSGKSSQSEIVGGMNAKEEFSCHVLLDTTKDKLRKSLSGWPLMHSARAATAAQYFEEKQASDFALYFARVRFPDFEHETGFSVLIVHRQPSYSGNDNDARYDIILLRINGSVNINSYESQIQLRISQENPKAERLCTIVGWYVSESLVLQTSPLWATLNATDCTTNFFSANLHRSWRRS